METDQELRERMVHMYEAVSNGDSAFLENFLADQGDVLMIGTDSDEWWSKANTIIEQLKTQAQSGVKLVPGNLVSFSEGSVGWMADDGKFVRPNGDEAPYRMTAVFHRENDEWKLIQAHVSKGVPNSELFD